MDFVLQQRNPVRKLTGLTTVVALHVVIALVFMQGLSTGRFAFTTPENITLVPIVETTPPPPKPDMPELVSRAQTTTTMPQPVVTDMPPVVIDTISAPTVDTPVVVSTGRPVSVSSDQGAVTTPSLGAACPNAQSIRSSLRYPAQARRDGLQGEVVARFMVAANGDIRNIAIVSSSHRAFNSTVLSAVQQFSCIAQGRDVTVEVPFSFKLD